MIGPIQIFLLVPLIIYDCFGFFNQIANISIVEIENLYACFLQSTGICTDSRSLQPGQLFWALKGPSFNGNNFAEEALKLGASFVVIDEESTANHNLILKVEDGLDALQRLALHHRRVWGKQVVAICGSNGKTTTKELITKALSVEKAVFATPGNFNNHIGVPISLLQIKPFHDIAVIEMGANHPGEIADLCRIAEPDFGLITNIGKDHLEGFGSLEGSANANAELFDFLEDKGGMAFINTTETWNQKLSSKISRHFTFPLDEDNAPCRYIESEFYVRIQIPESKPVSTQLTGKYNFDNLACALAVSTYFGINKLHALDAVASYAPTNNRSQIIIKGSNTIISDAYNANPSSILAALENLALLSSTNKIAILGDMMELGSDSKKEHFELGEWSALHPEIQYFIIGEEMSAFQKANPKARYFVSKIEFEQEIEKMPLQNAIILLKASRGMKLESLLALL